MDLSRYLGGIKKKLERLSYLATSFKTRYSSWYRSCREAVRVLHPKFLRRINDLLSAQFPIAEAALASVFLVGGGLIWAQHPFSAILLFLGGVIYELRIVWGRRVDRHRLEDRLFSKDGLKRFKSLEERVRNLEELHERRSRF